MAEVPNNIFKAMQPQSPFLTEDDEAPIEVDIGDPMNPIETEVDVEMEQEPGFDANLAEYMDEADMASLVADLLDDFNNDKNARKEWEST